MTKKLYGTDPDQVPTNADLGTMAYQDKDNVHLTGRVVVSAVNPAPFTVPNASESLEINDGSTTKLLMYADNSNAYIQASKYDGTNPGRTLIFATKQGTNGISAESARFNVNGNLQFPNGQGIDFSASAGSGQTSSLLDDYEEGTWTPTIEGSTTNPSGLSYTIQDGRYRKIGGAVYISFRVRFSYTSGTGSGSLYIAGLPFTAANHIQPKNTLQQDFLSFTGYEYIEMSAVQNNTVIGIAKNRSANSASSVVVSDAAAGTTDINGGIFYFV
jgi:hypothetical protein